MANTGTWAFTQDEDTSRELTFQASPTDSTPINLTGYMFFCDIHYTGTDGVKAIVSPTFDLSQLAIGKLGLSLPRSVTVLFKPNSVPILTQLWWISAGAKSRDVALISVLVTGQTTAIS